MEQVNFRTSKGIIDELENAVNDVKIDSESIEQVKARITGCKHAIQVFALTMEYNKMRNIKSEKLVGFEID
jgi:hypothetical protein